MIGLKHLDPALNNVVMNASSLIAGAANRYVIGKTGGAGRSFWGALNKSNYIYPTVATGLAAMTSGRNDVALLMPDSHTQVATLDWNKNICHLVGAYGPAMQNQRSRIGMSANCTPLLKVSGYGNTIANLYLMHGLGAAANLVALSVTGQRNSFINCHILAGGDGTEQDQAAYRLVSIDASEQYFENCFFGDDTVPWTNGAMLQLGASGDGGPPRAIFRNCIFLMNSDNAQVRFIDASLAGLGRCLMFFDNCQFINLGTALTYAINGAGLQNGQLYFTSTCSFAGATDIVALAQENYVWCGAINTNAETGTLTKLGNMIAGHPDVS